MIRKIGSLLGIVSIVYFMYSRKREVEFEFYQLSCDKINYPFRLIHLSDTHFPYHGFNPEALLFELKQCKPDIILLTGDIVDRLASEKDIFVANSWVSKLREICLVYGVTGNHDYNLFNHFDGNISQQEIVVNVNGNRIKLIGLTSERIIDDADDITLVLYHFPKSLIKTNDAFQFSGHAHGGQIRLMNQGLFSPDQGGLPFYTKGYYSKERLFVSAGLGGVHSLVRFNNPYHVIVVDFVV